MPNIRFLNRGNKRGEIWLYDQVGTGARVDILPGPLPPPDQLPP